MRVFIFLFLIIATNNLVFGQHCDELVEKIEESFQKNINPTELIREYQHKCNDISSKKISFLELFRLKQYRVDRDYVSGIRYAEKLLKKIDDSDVANAVILEKSILHFLLQDYEETIPLCYQLLKKKQISREITGKANSMLANAHWKLGNNVYAEKYFKKSYQDAIMVGDSSLVSLSINGLGLIDYNLGTAQSIKKSVRHFLRALEFCPKDKLTFVLNTKNNLAAAYYQLKDLKAANSMFLDCLELSRLVGDTSSMINSLNNLGSIALSLKDFKAAGDFLKLSLKTHEQFSPAQQIPSELLLALSDWKYALGDFQSSRDYLENYSNAELKRLDAERNQAMIEMQEEYDVLNKKKEIADLKLSRQRSQLANLKLQNLVTFIIVIFIVLSSVFVTFIALRRKKEKQEKRIELQRAGLEATENEKLRFSRELHDSMGGTFTVLGLLLSKQLEENPGNEEIKMMRELISAGTQDLRQICRDLYPQNLKLNGLDGAIMDLTSHLNNQQSEVEFSMHVEELSYDDGFAINMYRIVQELANNTLKYSQAQTAELRGYTVGDNMFRIDYFDNGIGVEVKNIKFGVGLNSILERTKTFYGKISFDKKSQSAPGFYVTVEFPLQRVIKSA
jgi:signal transduction histidine kinase